MTAADWKRKAVHAGIGLFALSLRWLDWRLAAACAIAALLANVILLPRFARGIYRDPSARHDAGIVAYPAMVALLILVFSGKHIPIAAAVWAMMAFGDPAASIAGRTVGGPTLPWNPGKTWVGLLSNWAVGGAASVLVFLFVSREHMDASTPGAGLILRLPRDGPQAVSVPSPGGEPEAHERSIANPFECRPGSAAAPVSQRHLIRNPSESLDTLSNRK